MATNEVKGIVIVSTQLQLLNASEYLCFKGYSNIKLILYSNSELRMRQMRELLAIPYIQRLFADKIEILVELDRSFCSIINSFSVLNRLNKIVKALDKCDECVIGHYLFNTHRYLYAQLYHRFKYTRLIVIDDGMATLLGNKERIGELKAGIPFVYGNRFILSYFRLRKEFFIPNKLSYFSVYKMDIAESDILIENNYLFLKGHVSDFTKNVDFLTADVIVLGQPLIQQGRMSKSSYFEYLILLEAKFKGRRIMYYPHPEEDISGLINEFPNIAFLKNIYSVELLTSAMTPNVIVVGWYTSALINIKKITPSRIVYALYIYEYEDDAKRYEEMLLRNDEYKKNGIELLYLKGSDGATEIRSN